MNTNGDWGRFYGGVGQLDAPTYVFGTEPVTGFYLKDPGAESTLAISKRGTLAMEINEDAGITFHLSVYFPAGTSVFIDQLGLEDGKVNDAPLFFSDHADTGMYYDSTDSGIGFAVGNTMKTVIASDKVRSSVPFRGAVGSESAPTYSWNGHSTGGVYWDTAGTGPGISSQSTTIATFGTSAITSSVPVWHPSGGVSTPSVAFSTESTLGLRRSAANQMAMTATGADMFLFDFASGLDTKGRAINTGTGSITGGPLSGSSATISGTSSVGGSMTTGALTSSSLNLGSGTLSTSGASTLGALTTTSVTSSGTISGTDITASGIYRASNGAFSAPAYSFTNSTNTGLSYTGTGWSLTHNGSSILSGDTTKMTTGVQLRSGPTGSASAPGIAFNNSTNSGMYWDSTSSELALSTAGTKRAAIGTTTTFTTPVTAGTNSITSGSVICSGTASIGGACTTGALTSSSLNLGNGFLTTSGSATVGALTSTTVDTGMLTVGNTASITGACTVGSLTTSGAVTLSGLSATGAVVTDGSKVLATTTSPTSFTPRIGDGTNWFTNVTGTGSSVRLGPLVIAWGNIDWNGKGSAVAGSALVLSLPIGVSATYYGGLTIGYNNGITFTGSTLQGFATVGQSYCNLVGVSNAGVPTSVLVSNANAAGQVNHCAIYSAV